MDIYTPNATQERVKQARSVFGDNPQAVKAGIAQSMTATPTFQQPIQDQGNAISAMQQIADYDKQLASKYQQGAQTTTNQINTNNTLLSNFASAGATPQETINKGAAAIPTTEQMPVSGFLSPFVASGLASGQQRAATDTFDIASQTRAALEKAVGTEAQAYADALKYQIEQERIKAEEERIQAEADERKKQQEFDNALNIAKLTGQKSFINPIDGKMYTIVDNEAEKKAEETNKKTADAWNTIVAGSKNEYDVWKQIDMKQEALRLSGVNVDELWRMHKNLVTRVGNGPLTGVAAGGNYIGQLTAAGKGDLLKDVPADQKEETAKYLVEHGALTTIDPTKTAQAEEVLRLAKDIKALNTKGVTGQVQAGTNWFLHPFGGAAKNEASLAKIDRLKSMLTMENLGLMKGVLSDTDIKILSNAASTLDNLNQPDYEIEAELDRIINAIETKLGISPTQSSPSAGPEPMTRGSIRVKLKATGQTGVIPESEFNAAIYERI